MLQKNGSFLLWSALLFSAFAGLLRWPAEAAQAVRDGLSLCAGTILPALFPFFILSTLTVESGLAARLGREPTISELSAETGLEPEDIAAAETAAEPVLSLQSETGEGGLTLEGMLTAGNEEESLIECLALRSALDTLPEREREVLLLRYYRGMTQVQTARIVGVSQVQVSRLERRALGKLREVMS